MARNKYRRKRIDDMDYVYTLGEFLFDLGDTLSFIWPKLLLTFGVLAVYDSVLLEWEKSFMYSWFSDSIKIAIRNGLYYFLYGIIGLAALSFIVNYVLFPLCSKFRCEFHNYTMLVTIFTFSSLGLSNIIPNYWEGFVAIPGAIMFGMWGIGLIIGILDLIF